jgi:quercetin dioxygenase-like cupin family protein
MVVVPAGSATFRPVIPDRPDGPQMAVLWGDPATGPSAMLLRFARGPGSLHIHTADYHLIVLEGSMKHWAAGESEATVPVLGPGSYWFQPGGVAHGDECVADSCLMQIVWSGPRDGRLADSVPQP